MESGNERGGKVKVITEQYYQDLVSSIIKEKRKVAEKLGQPFLGVSQEELREAVKVRVGESCMITKEESVKFSRSDINAVASARYFRRGGISLIMGLVIVLLLLAIVVKSVVVMTPLYYNIYYALCGLIAIGFLYIYSRQQAKVRKELWQQLGREEAEEGK